MNESSRTRVGDRVTIYPRGEKKWYCADFWRAGEHCRLSLKTKNKKIAIQRALKLESELASGTYQTAPPEGGIAETIASYLEFLQTEDRAQRTLSKYRGNFKIFVAFLSTLKVSLLHQFTALHFDRFRAERKKECQMKTLYTEGVLIKQFFKWCKGRRLVRENPVADFKLAKPPLVPKEGPSLENVDKILAILSADQRLMIALLAFTGMRSGELQRLRPEDFDLEESWIWVRSRRGAETKSRQSRKIPIHPRLMHLLRGLPKPRGSWMFTAPPSKKFPAGDHQVDLKKLNRGFGDALRSLGLPAGRNHGFTLHSLRHFFETFCINNNIPQRSVDAWLGHGADKSMGSVYYRLTDLDSQEFMKRVPFGADVTDGTGPRDVGSVYS